MLASPMSYPDGECVEVELVKKEKEQSSNSQHRPRNLSYLEAYCDQSTTSVNVYHEGLGNCVIYLVDSNNNVLERQEIISMNYSVEYLPVPDLPGDYTLVVDSDAMFAYGVITVY